MSRIRKFLPAVVFAVAIGVLSAQAIQTTGTVIRGVVWDPSKALIPGVEITLRSLERNEVRKTVSNARAQFSFDVTEGEYEMRAELRGFETTIIRPIQIKEGQTIQVDLNMMICPNGQCR